LGEKMPDRNPTLADIENISRRCRENSGPPQFPLYEKVTNTFENLAHFIWLNSFWPAGQTLDSYWSK
jgi:hypothetical protein